MGFRDMGCYSRPVYRPTMPPRSRLVYHSFHPPLPNPCSECPPPPPISVVWRVVPSPSTASASSAREQTSSQGPPGSPMKAASLALPCNGRPYHLNCRTLHGRRRPGLPSARSVSTMGEADPVPLRHAAAPPWSLSGRQLQRASACPCPGFSFSCGLEWPGQVDASRHRLAVWFKPGVSEAEACFALDRPSFV
jgi:hypothetical protein